MKRIALKIPKSRRARILAAVAGVAVLLLVVRCPRSGGRPVVETQIVELGLLEERVPATGTIHPAVEVRLAPDVHGKKITGVVGSVIRV